MAMMVHMHKRLSQRRIELQRAEAGLEPRPSCPAICRDRRSRISRTAAGAPDRCSGRAGSASDARASCISRGSPRAASAPPPAGPCRAPSPVRLPMRKMCVSTAMVGSPNAMLSTTLAVLRPTPGNACSASRVFGTWPPCSAISFCDSAMTFFALVRIEPDGLDQLADAVLAERRHLLRRVGEREQRRRRLVDAGVGRLRRQHHRDQERERIDVLQLALRLRHRGLKAAERFLDLGRGPRLASLPCSALSSALARAFARLDLGGLARLGLFHRLGRSVLVVFRVCFFAMIALY